MSTEVIGSRLWGCQWRRTSYKKRGGLTFVHSLHLIVSHCVEVIVCGNSDHFLECQESPQDGLLKDSPAFIAHISNVFGEAPRVVSLDELWKRGAQLAKGFWNGVIDVINLGRVSCIHVGMS